MTASALFVDRYPMAENWVMVVSEMHRYQGVSYKSDIIVISGIFCVTQLMLYTGDKLSSSIFCCL